MGYRGNRRCRDTDIQGIHELQRIEGIKGIYMEYIGIH